MLPATKIDSNLYSGVLGGHIITGVGDGTFFTVEQGAEASTKWVGAQGDVIFVFSSDTSASVTFRLKPDSPSNAVLHRLADAKAIVPFEFRDGNNLAVPTLIRAAQATIGSRPSMGRGNEVTVNEWVILLANTQQEV